MNAKRALALALDPSLLLTAQRLSPILGSANC